MQDNDVSINIPWNNPLYQWVIDNANVFAHGGRVPYVKLSVDDVECRLALTTVNLHCTHDAQYLDTRWMLLQSEKDPSRS